MGILDDAIKEHLELKRQHGADASELKQLEDEAFGAAERPGGEEQAPDPLAEAPTEFMQQPEAEAPEAEAAREVEETPEAEAPPEVAETPEPAEEESPAMEHEAVPEPEAQAPDAPEPPVPSGPTTEERKAIAEQPTEMYDLEEELAATEPEAEAEEELLDDEAAENKTADDQEDFFDEQRLSDELDQALEAPAEPAPAEGAADEGEGEDEAEDVLEETPDFLEEDEDERLWFEQQPPKDFDFDD